MITQELKNALEALIDANSLQTVLAATQEIVHEKADHIRENWQDYGLAKSWTRTGQAMDKAANIAEYENI